MAITVDAFLTRVAHDLHEDDNTFSSMLWTQAEMIGYLNYAERDFLRQTGIRKRDITVPMLPGTATIYTKPSGVMDIERISVNGIRVRRASTWDLEREDPDWRSRPNGKAHLYHEDHLPVNQFEFDHVPAAGGAYRMFCDQLPSEHTGDLTETLNVADIWEQYVRWEVLSLALGKDGDNQDIARSGYAHQRYMLGVSLAMRLVVGSGAPLKMPAITGGQ